MLVAEIWPVICRVVVDASVIVIEHGVNTSVARGENTLLVRASKEITLKYVSGFCGSRTQPPGATN